MAEVHKMEYLVIGGGPCGIGAAMRLEQEHQDWALVETKSEFGGLSGSFKDAGGFTWDIGGHVLFSHYETFDRAMREALGAEWFDHERESWVWLKERFIPYPFQNNLHRLDAADRWACVKGLLDAARRAQAGGEKPKDFGEWMLATMGEGIVDLFMKPYNFKVWAYPAVEMAYNWIGERVSVPPLEQVLKSICTGEDSASWGPNNLFRFPKYGGTGAIWRALGAGLPAERCFLNTRIVSIDTGKKEALDEAGNRWQYGTLISTMPLNVLAGLVRGVLTENAAEGMKYSATHVVGVGLEGQPPEHLKTKCWMYFPQSNSPYYRTTVFSNYSCNNVAEPGRQWSLMTEVAESPAKPVDVEQVLDDAVRAFREDRLIGPNDRIVTQVAVRVEHGYPTPYNGRDAQVDPMLRALEGVGIYSRGRFGAWKYEVANMDHSFAQGYECVDRLVHDGGEEAEPTLFTPGLVNSRKNP
ncbi:MAG: FAD-dependent oxidoreductase [Kiritimatiellae bacterium]|nr:FAD-dependent oxidoreductase [Kiritimatiellia bacterium]